jgi:hypothetical protein
MTQEIQPQYIVAKESPSPALDIEAYRADLAGCGLSAQQEAEILVGLWHIVKTVVDAGFGLDAASMVLTTITHQLFKGALDHEQNQCRSDYKSNLIANPSEKG